MCIISIVQWRGLQIGLNILLLSVICYLYSMTYPICGFFELDCISICMYYGNECWGFKSLVLESDGVPHSTINCFYFLLCWLCDHWIDEHNYILFPHTLLTLYFHFNLFTPTFFKFKIIRNPYLFNIHIVFQNGRLLRTTRMGNCQK